MPKVLFFASKPPDLLTLLTQHAPPGFDVHIYPSDLPDAEKKALARDTDFLILFPARIGGDVLRAAQHLKLIQLVGAGFDDMDLALCRDLGIAVANNGGANAIDVAEHTVALILALYRHLGTMDANVRNDRWNAIDSGAATYTIHGKTVGLVGLGNIGRRTAKLLNAFGADLIYADVYPAPPDVEAELGLERVELEALLGRADIVSLHVPLNRATRHLIDAHRLDLMKTNALLINTCRGGVVDEVALASALRSGVIAGAGLDVLDREPPTTNNPLLRLDNVILTPHIAGVTYDTWSRRGEFIFANLARAWRGEPPLATV